jgi:hypothetical protein
MNNTILVWQSQGGTKAELAVLRWRGGIFESNFCSFMYRFVIMRIYI